MPSPCAGLTETEFYTPLQVKSPGDRSNSVVFCGTFVWPATPGEGVILEVGGGGTGSLIGVLSGGNYLRIRFGDGGPGSTAPSTQIDTDISHIDIPTTTGVLAPYFDGQLHDTAWEYDMTTKKIRFWLDDNLIASSDSLPAGATGYVSTAGITNWGGGASGGYLSGTQENVDPDIGLVDWPGGTVGATNLSVYGNQVSTWVAGDEFDATSSLSIPSLIGSSTGTFVLPDLYDAVSTENLPSLIASTLATFQETLGYQIRAKVSVSGQADVYSNVEEIRYIQLGSAFSASSTVSLPMLTGSFAGTHRQSIKVYVDSNWVPSLAWYWDGSAWIPEHYQTSSGWV